MNIKNIPNYISYVNNELHIYKINYKKIINNNDTPIDCILLDRIRDNVELLKKKIKEKKAPIKIYYSIKASYLQEILHLIKKVCDGISVFSTLELFLARNSGFKNNQIIFNGVGRIEKEFNQYSLKNMKVIVESYNEFKIIKNLNEKRNLNINIGLRLSPKNIIQVKKINKKYISLGFGLKEAEKLISKNLNNSSRVSGLGFHIFSNKTNFNDYTAFLKKIKTFLQFLYKKYNFKIQYLDLGGGFASRMLFESDEKIKNNFVKIIDFIKKNFDEDLTFFLELGRFIVSDSSIILSKIVNKKRNYNFLDINTNYLIPAPGYSFFILPCKRSFNKKNLQNIFLDRMGVQISKDNKFNYNEGDYVAVLNTGAYTNVMKEQFVFYNPIKIYIKNKKILKKQRRLTNLEILKYHG